MANDSNGTAPNSSDGRRLFLKKSCDSASYASPKNSRKGKLIPSNEQTEKNWISCMQNFLEKNRRMGELSSSSHLQNLARKRRRRSTLQRCDSASYASPKNSCKGKNAASTSIKISCDSPKNSWNGKLIISSEFGNANSTSIKISDMDAGGAGVGMTMPFKNLTDDLIADILSRLPVKCVLKCRCVCKSWRIITLQKFFIDKHLKRNKFSQIVYEHEFRYKSKGDDQPYLILSHCNGLLLEKNETKGDFRIRNPATKQVLDQVAADSTICPPVIGFDSSTGKYKVISLCLIGGESPDFCVFLSSIGTDGGTDGGDLALRSSDFPLTIEWGRSSVVLVCLYDVCYAISYSPPALKDTNLVRFTVDGKTSKKIKLPRSFLSETVPIYQHMYVIFLGNDKLSLGILVGQDLQLWVLEDYHKHIWSEKKLIRLDFIKDYPNSGTIYFFPSPSLGLLRIAIANQLVEYDIKSKKLTCLWEVPPGTRVLYGLTPCLVSLKGMRSEETTLSQRLQKLLDDGWFFGDLP